VPDRPFGFIAKANAASLGASALPLGLLAAATATFSLRYVPEDHTIQTRSTGARNLATLNERLQSLFQPAQFGKFLLNLS
jgi:hypothetical protein